MWCIAMVSVVSCLFVFFFQAEDGIRDRTVTGVQTCALPITLARPAWYCSGCPHNTSTKPLEGSLVSAGIGCHTMAMWMDRNVVMGTHMGAEGAQWIGMAPFTDVPHIFQNMGDGTFFHSGVL